MELNGRMASQIDLPFSHLPHVAVNRGIRVYARVSMASHIRCNRLRALHRALPPRSVHSRLCAARRWGRAGGQPHARAARRFGGVRARRGARLRQSGGGSAVGDGGCHPRIHAIIGAEGKGGAVAAPPVLRRWRQASRMDEWSGAAREAARDTRLPPPPPPGMAAQGR
jgi:hypothetical protein